MINTNGYYIAKHSGYGVYDNYYEITMFLFFNNHNRVYYTDNQGFEDLTDEEVNNIMQQLRDIKDTDQEIAEFQVNGRNINMVFYRDDTRETFFQFKGIVENGGLVLEWINQTKNSVSNEIQKTVDIEGLRFDFIKR